MNDDLISRQAVLDALYELCNTGENLIENPWRDNPHIDALIDAIEELQPVNPQEPKTDVLDKIRDEIDAHRKTIKDMADTDDWFAGKLSGHDCDIEIIDKYRAESEQEPKTGHWIEKDGFDGDVYYDCSECGESWTTIEGTPWQNGMNYCPNCGARMESEV